MSFAVPTTVGGYDATRFQYGVTVATETINFPSDAVDGQTLSYAPTHAVAAVQVSSPVAQTVAPSPLPPPVSAAIGQIIQYVFDQKSKSWKRTQ